jgi:P27 family predicted phage terminase small subunit
MRRPGLRVLHGTARPAAPGPVPLMDEPVMPGWFTDAQAQVWERYAAQLRGMNLLYAADTDALVSLVLAVCQRDDAARVLQAEGLLTEGRRGGRVRHPATMIMRQANADIVRLSREFGLTPNARDSLRLPVPRQDPKDPGRLLTPPV